MDGDRIAGALGAAVGALVFVTAAAQSLKTDIPKQVVKVETPKTLVVRGPVVKDITPP
jgi:hypothetical protein